MTEHEEKIRRLHLEATRRSKSGNISGAVECLEMAQGMMPQVSAEYPIQQYLRLPLYLQKAGRYQESLDEFNRLLRAFPDPNSREVIQDKMRLATAREEKRQKS